MTKINDGGSEAPERIFAKVNGFTTRHPDGSRALIGGWCERQEDRSIEYIRDDLVPAPSVSVKTAAKHLLTIWDRWMASEDADSDAAFLMLQSACFAAQAYEDAASSDMTADSAPGQMLRTLLVALIDLSSPELDHLRACNRPAPPSEGVEP